MRYRMNAALGAAIALGVWLFVSAFLWPHNDAQLANATIVGVLCVVLSVAAMAWPAVRYAVTALAIWLFLSVWLLPSVSVMTIWNHVLVSVGVFIVSLLPTTAPLGPSQTPRPGPLP